MRDVATKPAAAAVVSGILSLGRNLGLECVAEGVETQQQLDYLKRQRCTEMQGFLFSPAVPSAECAVLLRAGKSAVTDVADSPDDRFYPGDHSLSLVN